MDDGALRRAAAAHGTPLYVASPGRLVRSMADLEGSLRARYAASDVAFSVKTNYLRAFLSAARDAGHLIEVVSDHELAYALGCHVPPRRIVLNGPISGELSRQLTATRSDLRVNADSLQQIRGWMALHSAPQPLGLRVSARLRDGTRSRFGLDLEEPLVEKELRRAIADGLIINGLHIHHSSQRSAASYVKRLDYLVAVADRLSISTLEYLDVGGGMASRVPAELRARLPYQVSTFAEYGELLGNRMRHHFPEIGPRLIVEPGIGMLADTMVYVTIVEAVKRVDGRHVIIVDGSSFDINPLRSSVRPPCRLLSGGSDGEEYQVMGATCMEVDVLGTLHSRQVPKPGDLVVHENVGAYSVSLQPRFIIQAAAVIDGESGRVLRQREELGMFWGGGT